ncbi:MAG TPA: nitrous oxide reductase accessory protein NosL [Geobacteraceae bacterium]|nr:nitrous oxide reductase accessory protein NosL [Geobacteraceae bacterium]
MRTIMQFLVLCLLLTGAGAIAAEKMESPKECKSCGMDRWAFANSRMTIVYADGTTAGMCSLNCAVVEMKANKRKKVKSLSVADYGTRKLIDARSAIWVLGGSKSGVMTEMPKWAFARKEDAQKFVREYGGRVATFDEALNLALKENE